VLAPDDQELFDEKCGPSLLFPVYKAIQSSRNDGRYPRAAFVYMPDTSLENGMENVEDRTELWGSKTAIEMAQKRKADDDASSQATRHSKRAPKPNSRYD
jgi:hypothetical protein